MKKQQSRRERLAAERRKKRIRNTLLWSGLAAVILVGLGLLLFQREGSAEAIGDVVPIDSATHVEAGTDPGPYPTNPPAGGKHYPNEYEPGFYDEESIQALPQRYEGYLVHNLEHGYVIFWYNCAADPDLDCEQLKSDIRQVMDEDDLKLIAFPWPSQEEPLVMTSWGRIMRFDQPDLDTMRTFVQNNRNKAPESHVD